jgi:hypothetical protein
LKEAVTDYRASIDVSFDVVEDAEQESLLPAVELDEDAEDALAFPVDTARATEGGQADVDFLLMQLFRAILDVEELLEDSNGDIQFQTALARAREEYRWTKEYALDTAAQQAGLTDEERAAAERAASGEPEDDGIVAEAPDEKLAE